MVAPWKTHGHQGTIHNTPHLRPAYRLAAADPFRQCRAARYYGANATRILNGTRLFSRNAKSNPWKPKPLGIFFDGLAALALARAIYLVAFAP